MFLLPFLQFLTFPVNLSKLHYQKLKPVRNNIFFEYVLNPVTFWEKNRQKIGIQFRPDKMSGLIWS